MNQSLLIQQVCSQQIIKTHHLKPGQSLSIGPRRRDRIRSVKYHGKISFENGRWTLIRNELELSTSSSVQFDGFCLQFQKVDAPQTLFLNKQDSNGGGNANSNLTRAHLITVHKNENLVFSKLLSENEVFDNLKWTRKPIHPHSRETQYYHHDGFVIGSRLVAFDKTLPQTDGRRKKKWKHIIFSAKVVLILVVIFQWLHSDIKNGKKPNQPPKNRFTKIIYDSEEFTKAQNRAQEVLKKEFKVESTVITSGSKEPRAGAPVQQVVKALKDSGIKDMIAKIANRSISTSSTLAAKSSGSFSSNAKRRLAGIKTGLAKTKGSLQLVSSGKKNIADLKKLNGDLGEIAQLKKGRTGSGHVNVLEEETLIEGGLDPEVIAKVIRSHLGEVRYCYERQLSQHTDLQGKVRLNFSIAANGSVSWQKIKETTLKNAMVEGCILRRVAKWKFPTPKGGTSVNVTYPFLLKSIN